MRRGTALPAIGPRLLGLAAVLALLGLVLAAGARSGAAARATLWQVTGRSLDWRDVAHGEQLLVGNGGEIVAVAGDHSAFELGSTVEFAARRVACLPASADVCYAMTRWLAGEPVQTAQVRVVIHAILLSEANDSVSVAAIATPVGQPRLIFTFPADARTLAAAQVHTGGLVQVTLERVKGGAVGPEADSSLYSWRAISLRPL